MDECKVCGRTSPIEGANFCYYCGSPLRDRTSVIETDNARTEDAAELVEETGEIRRETPKVSRWKVAGILCLLLIPVYGWLFLIGWLIVSACNPNLPEDRKEVVKGALLFIALLAVLVIIAGIYLANNPDYFSEVMKQYESMYAK